MHQFFIKQCVLAGAGTGAAFDADAGAGAGVRVGTGGGAGHFGPAAASVDHFALDWAEHSSRCLARRLCFVIISRPSMRA
jgi:hypothetical protein